ncbi:hypothetical protein [Streptomyces murinus]|uniref:hypothetical protein n=1 Tax=Streptomyces murinus TaxID=33900 RepID=UPI003F46E343
MDSMGTSAHYIVAPSESSLSYSCQSSPGLIPASSEQNQSLATLTLSAKSKTSESVVLKAIVLGIPVGSQKSDLTEANTLRVEPGPGLVQSGKISTDRKTYFITLTAKDTSAKGMTVKSSQVIAKVFDIPVNKESGESVISIREDGEQADPQGEAYLPIVKYPTGFEFGYFHPNTISVPAGEPVALQWDGKNAISYYLTYKGVAVQLDGSANEYKVCGLTSRTAFALQAHVQTQDRRDMYPTLTTVVDVAGPASGLDAHDVACNGVVTCGNIRMLNRSAKSVDFTISPKVLDSLADEGIRIQSTGDGFISFRVLTEQRGRAEFLAVTDMWPGPPSLISGEWSSTLPMSADSAVHVRLSPESAEQLRKSSATEKSRIFISWVGHGRSSAVKYDSVDIPGAEPDAANLRVGDTLDTGAEHI